MMFYSLFGNAQFSGISSFFCVGWKFYAVASYSIKGWQQQVREICLMLLELYIRSNWEATKHFNRQASRVTTPNDSKNQAFCACPRNLYTRVVDCVIEMKFFLQNLSSVKR